MTKVICIYTPTIHFYVHYKKNNCKKLIWVPIKVFVHFCYDQPIVKEIVAIYAYSIKLIN
jgi:hypothetical protein